eukprot:2527836-Pleurochrysis_carterae.AAC.2
MSPAQGVAAVGPRVCRLRAPCVVSSPAHTGAANVPPPNRSLASSWARPRPVHTEAGAAATPGGTTPTGPPLGPGGGSGGGGGRCGCAGAARPPAGGSGPARAPAVSGSASAGATGARGAPSPAP